MKTPMYDRDPLVRVSVTLSTESFGWLSDKRNQVRLREILDEKLGTNTQRKTPSDRP